MFRCDLQILSETSLIIRRTERDIIKNSGSLHVKCPLFLSDFHETRIFSTVFRKILKCLFSWKSVQLERKATEIVRKSKLNPSFLVWKYIKGDYVELVVDFIFFPSKYYLKQGRIKLFGAPRQ